MPASIPRTWPRLIAIEGLGPSPKMLAERFATGFADRMRAWIEEQRGLSGRLPRRYAGIEDAWKRMQEENKHLSPEQARHLTQHGVNQNEDGTYSWKFDNYVRSWPPYDMTTQDVEGLWARITCPTLLVYGKESWASNPPRTAARSTSSTLKSSPSTAPATGCTTTGSPSSWQWRGGFWQLANQI